MLENLYQGEPLIPPSFLESLSPGEQAEALQAAWAAKRAEERAEQRALERALQQKQKERLHLNEAVPTPAASQQKQSKVVFVPKQKRRQKISSKAPPENGHRAEQKLQDVAKEPSKDNQSNGNGKESKLSARTSTNGPHVDGESSYPSAAQWTDKEVRQLKETYLGKSALQEEIAREEEEKRLRKKKKNSSKKMTFRFEWDNTDDTLDESDPLYAGLAPSAPVGHRKRGAGAFADDGPSRRVPRRKRTDKLDLMSKGGDFMSKPIDKMTSRDWRIFRENFEIVVKGGRAPPPLRSFQEQPSPEVPKLHATLLDALSKVLKYKEPTPIQRQAIPIGLQRRDLIGIAETGSGKTCAFGVPLLNYLINLPDAILDRVAVNGPLALVVAPTRELALQIHGEFEKMLSLQTRIRTASVVGGQPIQQQAQVLRRGVHVVVGTPGRMNDCIDMAYMVLNQCCYIVLDEADRMIDMGFAPQMESILDAMGGLLKSENENEAYEQEAEDLKNFGQALPRHRVTAMFSATMPLEVEQIAKRYVRHPAVISIGDQDSSKNARIHQKVIFLSSPSQKEKALRELIQDPRFLREKVIVFVNEKKHADGIGRMVERFGRQCVVLHGGKSQEQREENLETFRRGGVVLVATDVAGRGLDIPNVAHVINYDLPTRSIESYTHRIGRTGRAGKEGYATSLLTEEDEGIMAPLKAYLESTGSQVPDKLAKHPAAAGTSLGNLIY